MLRYLFVTLFTLSATFSFAYEPGDPIELSTWKDYRGGEIEIGEWKQGPIIVLFMGTECPLVKLYVKRLIELQQEFAVNGVKLVGVMSNSQDSLADIAQFAKSQEINFPIAIDPGAKIADKFKADRTPEVYLLDPQHQLKYRGRIDDQYAVGGARKTPQNHELRTALIAMVAGKPILLNRTEATGCIIGRAKAPQANAKVTYHSDIAAIFQNRCVTCHRDGEVAPFAMTDFDEVRGWAEMIGEVVAEGRMPPWHADPKYGHFANDPSLTANEKNLIAQWVASGAPLGDVSQPLPQREFSADWQLPHAPDLVIDVTPQPVDVAASGEIKYQYFSVDPGLTEDRWVTVAELQPGNRAVVHHILAFVRQKGASGGLEGQRGFFTGYVPGYRVEPFATGYAKRIPANSEFVFQVHYTPVGSAQQDQSRLGLIFCDPESVTHEVHTSSAVQPRLRIPPGEANYSTSAETPEKFVEGAELLAMAPHMHVRGKSFRYELLGPDGDREVLLDVPHYDFNWQHTYFLKESRPLPVGGRMACFATFDNSAGNPFNPDPKALVHWGDQTWDEMMIGYFHYALPVGVSKAKQVGSNPADSAKNLVRKVVLDRLMQQLDRDRDGRLQRAEVPDKHLKMFDQLDTNSDKVVSRDELSYLPQPK